jgi:hypothetical protein
LKRAHKQMYNIKMKTTIIINKMIYISQYNKTH